MSTPRTRTNSAPDQHLLVLLAIGVVICLFRVLPVTASFVDRGHDNAPAIQPVYCWLAGKGLAEGLYRIDPELLADPGRASSYGLAGLTLPADPGLQPVAAFQLNANDLPLSAEAPPGLAPFFFAPIAVNRADRELLMTLHGIGPHLADGIITLRQKKYKLNELHELLEVKGIGKARIKNLEGMIIFD